MREIQDSETTNNNRKRYFSEILDGQRLNRRIANTNTAPPNLNTAFTETIPFTQNTKESVMGPLEAFLRSIPEHDQQRKKDKETSNALLWRPPIAPPLSEMADLTLQPSTSTGHY